jgi:hypothetical protein
MISRRMELLFSLLSSSKEALPVPSLVAYVSGLCLFGDSVHPTNSCFVLYPVPGTGACHFQNSKGLVLISFVQKTGLPPLQLIMTWT